MKTIIKLRFKYLTYENLEIQGHSPRDVRTLYREEQLFVMELVFHQLCYDHYASLTRFIHC